MKQFLICLFLGVFVCTGLSVPSVKPIPGPKIISAIPIPEKPAAPIADAAPLPDSEPKPNTDGPSCAFATRYALASSLWSTVQVGHHIYFALENPGPKLRAAGVATGFTHYFLNVIGTLMEATEVSSEVPRLTHATANRMARQNPLMVNQQIQVPNRQGGFDIKKSTKLVYHPARFYFYRLSNNFFRIASSADFDLPILPEYAVKDLQSEGSSAERPPINDRAAFEKILTMLFDSNPGLSDLEKTQMRFSIEMLYDLLFIAADIDIRLWLKANALAKKEKNWDTIFANYVKIDRSPSPHAVFWDFTIDEKMYSLLMRMRIFSHFQPILLHAFPGKLSLPRSLATLLYESFERDLKPQFLHDLEFFEPERIYWDVNMFWETIHVTVGDANTLKRPDEEYFEPIRRSVTDAPSTN